MSSSLFWIILVLMLEGASVLGYVFLVKSVAKTSKKYQAFILRSKKQGNYEEWTHQHKSLVLLEKIYQYIKVSFIVLVLIGFVIEFASIPKIAKTILEVIAYTYWPLAFILMISLSKLHKKVPELQD